MGDRTYITFTVNGHIPNIAVLDELCEALSGGDFYEERDRYPHSAGDDPIQSFADAVLNDPPADCIMFVNQEGYIIDAEPAQAVCEEHGIAYQLHYDAGDEYPAGDVAFVPGEGAFEAPSDGDNSVIPVTELLPLLTLPDAEALAALRARIDTAAKANGRGQPTLSVSDEVRAHLAAWMEGDD